MSKLHLIFNDGNRVKQRIVVDENSFSIGRGAENDLTIANASLSRYHAKIERLADIFVLSDNGSSNGTQLNGKDLMTGIALSDGDKITFGGAVNVKVEISDGYDDADDDKYNNANDLDDFNESKAAPIYETTPKIEKSSNVAKTEVAPIQPNPTNANSRNLIWLVPIGGVFVLLLITVIIFLFSGDGSTKKTRKTDVAEKSNAPRNSKTLDDSTISANDSNNLQSTTNANLTVNENQNSNSISNVDVANNDIALVNAGNSELDAIGANAQKFLRNISRESNPILTQKQLVLINAKIKSLKNSSVVRDNLRDAAKNDAQFQSIASANGLKPQFLSVFALAKLNESRGDALSTANAALPNLKRLSEVLGSELSNDCLLVIAANAEGTAPNEMRDKLTSLAKQTPNVSVTTIRSIWFLHEKGKIRDSAFDFAIRFIAIGAMSNRLSS